MTALEKIKLIAEQPKFDLTEKPVESEKEFLCRSFNLMRIMCRERSVNLKSVDVEFEERMEKK